MKILCDCSQQTQMNSYFFSLSFKTASSCKTDLPLNYCKANKIVVNITLMIDLFHKD